MTHVLLTAAQVALQLGLKPRSVYDLADSGRLVCYRLGAAGGAVRFAQADVDAYLQGCRCEAGPIKAAPMCSSAVLLKPSPARSRAVTAKPRKARPYSGARP